MIRSKALRHRVFAAFVLFGFAIGSVVFWNDGELDLTQIAVNCTVALIGVIMLHLRWRKLERQALTPKKVKDIFS